MDSISKKVKITVLSPLHIGCGVEWKEGADYVVVDNKIFFLDNEEILRKLEKNHLQSFSNALSRVLANNGDMYSLCKDFFQKDYMDILRQRFPDIDKQIAYPAIKCSVRNPLNNNPIIPGSSIKGAVRTIVIPQFLNDVRKIEELKEAEKKIEEIQIEVRALNKELKKSQDKNDKRHTDEIWKVISSKNEEIKKEKAVVKRFKNYLSALSKIQLPKKYSNGKNNDGNFDWMSCIHIADIEMPKTRLFNTNLFDLYQRTGIWNGGWKVAKDNNPLKGIYKITPRRERGKFNTIYECIEPGQEGTGTFSLRRDMLERLIETEDVHKYPFLESIEGLFYMINQHTIKYLEKEIAFFKKYQTDGTDKIIKSLNEIILQTPNDGKPQSCVFKMSAGSGFHSITGDWKYENHIEPLDAHLHPITKSPIPYKTRRIVEYKESLTEMGFVKLTAL